jgi:hypothetical protein
MQFDYVTINMSCEVPECLKDATNICESCSTCKYLCTEHSINHVNSNQTHSILFLNKEQLFILHIRSLKSDIKKCISQITDQTYSIISAVKSSSNDSIKHLKNLNNNMTQILKFQPLYFDKRRINFLIDQAKLLATDMEKTLEVEKQKDSYIQELKEMNTKLNQELVDSKSKNNEIEVNFNELLDKKQGVIKALENEIELKNTELFKLNKHFEENKGVSKEAEKKEKEIKGFFK